MCFHYALNTEGLKLAHRYKVDPKSIYKNFKPIFHVNGFKHPKTPIIIKTTSEKMKLEQGIWGLIPDWVKSTDEMKKISDKTLNARKETILERKSFSKSFKLSRCLIPATGFFEWQHKQKQTYPHYIYLKGSGIFSFAGIFSKYHDPDTGKAKTSFSIITTKAKGIMKEIHNTNLRMPFILSKEQEKDWLCNNIDLQKLKNLEIDPLIIENLKAHPISRDKINSDINVDMRIFAKYNYPELNQEQLTLF